MCVCVCIPGVELQLCPCQMWSGRRGFGDTQTGREKDYIRKKSKIIMIIIICKYVILDYVYYVIKAKLSYHFVARFCSHNGKLPVITFNGSMAEMRQEKNIEECTTNYYRTSSKNLA